jgi:hypothetical protein
VVLPQLHPLLAPHDTISIHKCRPLPSSPCSPPSPSIGAAHLPSSPPPRSMLMKGTPHRSPRIVVHHLRIAPRPHPIFLLSSPRARRHRSPFFAPSSLACWPGVDLHLRLRSTPADFGRSRRVGGGAIIIGWTHRAIALGFLLAPAVARRSTSTPGGSHLLHRRVVVCSTGDNGIFPGFREEGAYDGRSSWTRTSPSDGAKGATLAR